MSSLGADILHKHGEFEFATPRRLSAATSPKESIVSDEAMLKLMDSVRKQIKLFETTTHGYKSLISALMARLKEMKSTSGGEELRQELAQAERDRDAAMQEVADLKKLLAEQNRQLAAAAKTRSREVKDLETLNLKLLADVRAANAAEAAANEAKAAVVEEQKKSAASAAQLSAQVKELEAMNRKLSAELHAAVEAAKNGAAAAAAPAAAAIPRRAQSKSTLADGSRDLESINRKLAAELRAALSGEAKANEARVVAENKIEAMRIEMGSMIKAARQASNNNAANAATVQAAESAEVKRLKEEVAGEKQQVALLRKQLAAEQESVAEVKKLQEQLQTERLLTTGLRKELSDRNKEALAIKAESGEARRAKDELQAERQVSGQLRRDLAERSKELQLLTQEAGDVRKLKEDLAAERQLCSELRKELAERNKQALAGKAAIVANAGRPHTTGVVYDSPLEWQRMNDAELRSRLQVMSESVTSARAETAAREAEVDRLSGEVSNLNKLLSNKDRTIADLTLKLSSAHTASVPAGNKHLDDKLETLEAKQNKLDADMELMEENLTLQANLAEKDDLIDQLRKQLKELKK